MVQIAFAFCKNLAINSVCTAMQSLDDRSTTSIQKRIFFDKPSTELGPEPNKTSHKKHQNLIPNNHTLHLFSPFISHKHQTPSLTAPSLCKGHFSFTHLTAIYTFSASAHTAAGPTAFCDSHWASSVPVLVLQSWLLQGGRRYLVDTMEI